MKYIVHGEFVSRDIYYFCKKLKEENKSFIFLNFGEFSFDVKNYINKHDDYDCYININEVLTAYYTKGEAITKEWFEKDRWTKSSVEDLEKRYQKSKFKDTLTFEEWYSKNGWSYMTSTTYEPVCHDIPKHEKDEFVSVERKLFSEIVMNSSTLSKLNELKDKEIKYVLRDDYHTEIIYFDDYLEIEENDN